MKICINKSYRKKNLSWKVIPYLCILGMFFVTACKKTSVETKETPEPPKEKLAEPDWQNPDFPGYSRTWRPDPTRDRRGSYR